MDQIIALSCPTKGVTSLQLRMTLFYLLDGFWVWGFLVNKIPQTSLHNPNFIDYAKNRGGLGIRVTEAEVLNDELPEALAHDGPGLVEIMADAELIWVIGLGPSADPERLVDFRLVVVNPAGLYVAHSHRLAGMRRFADRVDGRYGFQPFDSIHFYLPPF